MADSLVVLERHILDGPDSGQGFDRWSRYETVTPLFMLIWDLLWDDGTAGWWFRRITVVVVLAASVFAWFRFAY